MRCQQLRTVICRVILEVHTCPFPDSRLRFKGWRHPEAEQASETQELRMVGSHEVLGWLGATRILTEW